MGCTVRYIPLFFYKNQQKKMKELQSYFSNLALYRYYVTRLIDYENEGFLASCD